MHKKEHATIAVLLIVIAAIGLAFFSNEGITGLAIFDTKKNNPLAGSYSFSPDIKKSVDYSFDAYEKLKKDIDAISSCVSSGEDIAACKDKREFTKEYALKERCEKGLERVFYDVAGLYGNCLESKDTNCLCVGEFGGKDYIEAHSLRSKSYTIDADYSSEEKTLDISSAEDLSESFSLEQQPSSYLPLSFQFSYGEGGLSITTLLDGDPSSIPKGPSLTLLKETQGELTTLNLVGQSASLVYANGQQVIKNGRAAIANDFPACTIPKETIRRFCLIDEKKLYLVYDPLENSVVKKNPTIRFAISLKDTPPPPLTALDALNSPKSTGTLIVQWKKSIATDVEKYLVYSSQDPSTLQSSILQIKQNPSVTAKEFVASSAEKLPALPSFDSCVFENANGCAFTVSGSKKILEKNKLYAAPDSEKNEQYFVLLDGFTDGIPYSIGATAIDFGGNEIDNDKQLMPVKIAKPEDQLPPSSSSAVSTPSSFDGMFNAESKMLKLALKTEPTSNVDGTPLKDFSTGTYTVYASTSAITPPTPLKDLITLPYALIEENGQKKLSIDLSGAASGTYYLVVVAEDANKNPKKELFSIEELKADIQAPLAIS